MKIKVQCSGAKAMDEIGEIWDEDVGKGFTSVIILVIEVLEMSQQVLEKKMNPTVVIQTDRQAVEDDTRMFGDNVFTKFDNMVTVRKVIQGLDLAPEITLDAVSTVTTT